MRPQRCITANADVGSTASNPRSYTNITTMTSCSGIPQHGPLTHYRHSVLCLLAFFTLSCSCVFVQFCMLGSGLRSPRSLHQMAPTVPSPSMLKTMLTKHSKYELLTMTKKAAIIQQVLSGHSKFERIQMRTSLFTCEAVVYRSQKQSRFKT